MNANPVKIPISLSIISYIFLAFGIILTLAGCGGLLGPMINLPAGPFIRIALGLSYIWLSRGLRRCSRGWYIYAVVMACFHLLAAIYVICRYFGPLILHGSTHSYRLISLLIFDLSIDAWVLLTLLRLDIRNLFSNAGKTNPN